MSPAQVLNELFQLCSIALEPGLQKEHAENVAIEYILKMRAHVWDLTRVAPFESQDIKNKLQDLWHSRDPTFFEEARSAAPGAGSGKGSAKAQSPGTVACLWHQIGNCQSKDCRKSHVCPFCGDRKSQCLVGHLAALKAPKIIIPKDKGGKPSGKGDWRNGKGPRTLPWETKSQGGGPNVRQRSKSRGRSRSRNKGEKDRRKRSRS